MKCPICGKEEFICPDTEKFLSFGDQHLNVKGYVCLNCGHIEFDGSNFVHHYKELKEKVSYLKNEISNNEAKIKDINSRVEKLRDLKCKLNMLYNEQTKAIANNQDAKEINNKIISLEKKFEKEEQDLSVLKLNEIQMDLQNKKRDLVMAETELKQFRII